MSLIKFSVGVRRIELRPREPESRTLPLCYTPTLNLTPNGAYCHYAIAHSRKKYNMKSGSEKENPVAALRAATGSVLLSTFFRSQHHAEANSG